MGWSWTDLLGRTMGASTGNVTSHASKSSASLLLHPECRGENDDDDDNSHSNNTDNKNDDTDDDNDDHCSEDSDDNNDSSCRKRNSAM